MVFHQTFDILQDLAVAIASCLDHVASLTILILHRGRPGMEDERYSEEAL